MGDPKSKFNHGGIHFQRSIEWHEEWLQVRVAIHLVLKGGTMECSQDFCKVLQCDVFWSVLWYECFENFGAMHFIYSHKYNTNSTEDSSDMNRMLFRA